MEAEPIRPALADTRASGGLSDEQLVERVNAGQVPLFEVLIRRHNARVYRVVRAVLRDEADVEDCMQTAYLQAFRQLGTFRAEARFSTWMIQIALNLAITRLRSGSRHPTLSLSAVPEESLMSSTPDVPAPPEAAAQRRELATLLERAVDALPELYRVVFMLREVEGLDTAETAAALGVSADVVKTRLSRPRRPARRARGPRR